MIRWTMISPIITFRDYRDMTQTNTAEYAANLKAEAAGWGKEGDPPPHLFGGDLPPSTPCP